MTSVEYFQLTSYIWTSQSAPMMNDTRATYFTDAVATALPLFHNASKLGTEISDEPIHLSTIYRGLKKSINTGPLAYL
jgi:hypothetical protein